MSVHSIARLPKKGLLFLIVKLNHFCRESTVPCAIALTLSLGFPARQQLYPLSDPFGHRHCKAHASASAAASSTPTATRRETPGSCMVTPMRRSDASMAILLWVI